MTDSIPAIILIALGALLLIAAGIWTVVIAFRRSFVWGLCYLFVPFAALVFFFVAWADVKRTFYTHLVGFVIFFGGILLAIRPGLDWEKQVAAQFGGGLKLKSIPVQPDPKQALQKRFDELTAREKSLLARKAALDPQDISGSQGLTVEILRYNDDLKAAHAESAALAGAGAQVVSYVSAPK